jgi:uncharacterized protein (DUF2345 family)
MDGAKSLPAVMPSLQPHHAYDEAFILKSQATGKPLPYTKYRIKRANGEYEYGMTDKSGATHVVLAFQVEPMSVEIET